MAAFIQVAARRVPFTDLVSRESCGLWLPDGKVSHPRCAVLADVSVELDAFYCMSCGRNGRVSGAWVAQLLAEYRAAR